VLAVVAGALELVVNTEFGVELVDRVETFVLVDEVLVDDVDTVDTAAPTEITETVLSFMLATKTSPLPES
jgi:hypothetical protein